MTEMGLLNGHFWKQTDIYKYYWYHLKIYLVGPEQPFLIALRK